MNNFKINLNENSVDRCEQVNATEKEGTMVITICDYTEQ